MWELDYKESWAPKNLLLNCGVGEDSWESLGLQGDPTSPFWRRSALGVHCKGDWCWSWNSNTLATWCKELTHWKRPWCWERLKVGGEGDDRGWDGGWHHWLDGHGFRWTPQVGDGQGGLVCCGSWGHKESDTTEWLSWTDIYWKKTHVNGLTQSKLMLFEGQLWPVLLKQAVNMPSPPGQPGPLCHACSLCALHYFVSRRTLPGLSVPNK